MYLLKNTLKLNARISQFTLNTEIYLISFLISCLFVKLSQIILGGGLITRSYVHIF